jgi:hypothetical protein
LSTRAISHSSYQIRESVSLEQLRREGEEELERLREEKEKAARTGDDTEGDEKTGSKKKRVEEVKRVAPKMRSAVEMKLLQDLRFSKSSYNPWGRQIIR